MARRQTTIAIEKQRANTATANAEAARAQAETARIQAAAALAAQQAEAARQAASEREAERVRRAAEATDRRRTSERARERLYQLGINTGAPVVGAGVGYVVARAYKKQTAAMVAAQAPQLKALATQASRLIPVAIGTSKKAPASAARLAAITTTARRMRLARGGPLGLGIGAMMVAEGAFSRFVLAPGIENPVAREAVSAVGTASLFAASMLVSKRVVQNRLMVPARNPVHVATLEAARRITTGGGNVIQRMAAGQGLREAIASGAGLRRMAPMLAAAPVAAPRVVTAAAAVSAPPAAAASRVLTRVPVRAAAVVAVAGLALTLASRFRGANAGAAARGGSVAAGAGAATSIAGAGTAPAPAAAPAAPTSGGVVQVHSYMRRGQVGGAVRVSSYVRHLSRMSRRR